MEKQVDVKKAYGLIKDARGNARYVREMMTLVEVALRKMDASSDRELCKQIMAAAGVENAIATMEKGTLDFIEDALENLAGEGGAA